MGTLGIALSSFLLASRGILASSPPVQVELRASWPAPPLLLECIESIALEQPEIFFPLLDILTDPETLPEAEAATPQALHEYALESAIAHGFLGLPGAYAAVEMNLALHVATPKIEAFYQYYTDRHPERLNDTSEECSSWVDWYGQVVCTAEELVRLAAVETIDPAEAVNITQSFTRPSLMPIDHIHPTARVLERPLRTAILYGSLTSKNFRELHSYLYASASAPNPHIEYVFRPIPPAERDLSQRTYLSGYGVALDLKKMDYLALDDRQQAANEENGGSDEASAKSFSIDPILALLDQYPEEDILDASAALTENELLELGIKATQLVRDSEDPLSALKLLAQNFPKYAMTLARRVTLDVDVLEEVENNYAKVTPGAHALWLNGVILQEKDLNPFALLRLLRKERSIMLSLTSLDMTPEQAFKLLTHPNISEAQTESDVLEGVFDASDRPEGGQVVAWWNDLESEGRYSRWGKSLKAFIRQTYPGQFPSIRVNAFNVILAMDLSQSSSLHFLSTTVANLVSRAPFRWGIVPLVETEDGTKIARLFYFLVEHYGAPKTMGFLKRVSKLDRPIHLIQPTIDWVAVRATYSSLLASTEPLPEGIITDLDAILNGKVDSLEEVVQKASTYAARLGATIASASQGHAFVNGKHLDIDDDFLRYMQIELRGQMEHIQEQIIIGELTDEDTPRISTYFYDLPVAAKRRNGYIYPSGKVGDLQIVNMVEVLGESGFPSWGAAFVYPPEPEPVPFTAYIVADFDSEGGQQLVKEALKSVQSGLAFRLSFIHNPTSGGNTRRKEASVSNLLAHLVTKGLLHRLSPAQLLQILGFGEVASPSDSPQIVISREAILDAILDDTIMEAKEYNEYIKASQLIVRDLGLSAGHQALVVNGRVIGPMQPGEFAAEDFVVLSAYESKKRIQPVINALEDIFGSLDHLDRGTFAEIVSMTSSIIASIQLPDPSEVGLSIASPNPRQRKYQLLDGDYTTYTLGANKETALFHIGVVIDPLSEPAQKWSSLMQWLLNMPDVSIELHLNPVGYTELPLKRFYRYNLTPKPTFDENGNEIRARTEFLGLPTEPIYTLTMDVPQSWLVRPRESLHDLDNILLNTLSGPERAQGVKAVFDLDYLVIEGHARDVYTNAPPRGVQLQLTAKGEPIADTLVVANLGYLQFRTKPGVFSLEIRPGRGREIFKMESVGNEGWHSKSVDEVGDEITLTSFEGLVLYPRLARLPGMERADVLKEVTAPNRPNGLLEEVASWLSSWFSKETSVDVAQPQQADINIFTVASGLLYERFASIMVLSVLRNTQSTVKFWFIENFLSPSFLEFLPHFAEAYGFQYELVTYKWPSWLRAQKEKQRIIWAYKILFLDILFPMDLKKVIFVDADQIVRADLKELVELDLHGAPYGYTPMGDDNVEMEGFRFWKTGYWKDFLRGLPYHISALYVVDLVRFRQMGAGDMLRASYQQLSADPNSLANLDQDLPNNLQREVPIFSLPEDWLWCETWCSKDRLHRAKTIDLCQNPLTKEPKLARARQIPEWEEYDGEIARFARSLAEEGKMRSEIVAADVNVLADVGKARVAIEKPPAEDAAHTGEHDESHPKDEL